MTQDRQKIMAAGFDGYQDKPIDVNEFVAAVRAMLDRSSPGGRPAKSRRAVSEPARILVVDDTPMNVKLLADVLVGNGYEVITAPSRREAPWSRCGPSSRTSCSSTW